MASAKKISELTTAGPLTGAELVPIVQNGGTLQTTISDLVVLANISLLPVVSALQTQVNQVSALTSVNAAAITSTNAVLNTLEVRVSGLSAAITSVNAVVSTKVNRVGDFMDSVQYIEFNTSTIVSSSIGRLSWSIDEGTLDIGLDNQGVILHTGLQLYQRVYNDTSATLPKGAVVRITGSQGQRLTAALALANNDANSATTFAFMAEPVSVNRAGFALTEGVLKNIDTGGIPDGSVLWLSPVSAGVYTPVKPVAPQHLVPVGFVVKGNSVGAGSVYVKIINGLELGELHDVKVSSSTSLANGEVLAYDTSAGVWTNSTALINAQASISVLNIQMAAVQTSIVAINSALAAIDTSAVIAFESRVSTLEILVANLSAAVSANTASITSIDNVVSALEVRVSNVSAAVVSTNTVVANVSALVSALDIRVAAVSASVSSLQIQLNDVSAALTSTNNVVSALEIRVSAASATGVTNASAITSVNDVVSALEIRVSAASATGVTNASAIVSVNNVVSALEIRVSSVSAVAAANAGSITSVNNVVSALEIRVSAASATGALNAASIVSINAVLTSILAILTNTNFRVTES